MFDTADSAALWFNIFNGVLLLGAFLVLVGTWGAFKAGAIKELFSGERIAANEAETKRAIADSDAAKEGTATANERIAELSTQSEQLRKDAAEAKERTAEAELKLEQLRTLAGPRGLNEERLRSELAGRPGVKVAIWYVPDSSDGFSFAQRLQFALMRTGWEPSAPIPLPDIDEEAIRRSMPSDPEWMLGKVRGSPRSVLAGGRESGVTVVGDLLTAAGFDPGKAQDTPFMVLFNALARSTNFSVSGSPASPYNPVPPGTLRVVIAAKADPIFIPTPITK